MSSEGDECQVDLTVGDISDENFVNQFVGKAVNTFGRIDYAVNCAGVLGPALRTHETPTSVFDQINNVNYRGSWLVNKALFSHMKTQEPLEEHPLQKGSIVNIASQLGLVGRPAAGKPGSQVSNPKNPPLRC